MSMTMDLGDITQRGMLSGQFNADRDDGYADPSSAPFGYWVKPDGYITWGQYGPNGLPKSMRGWRPLAQYGQRPQSGGAGAWKPEFDPYLMIISRGGLREFPPEQVITLGWHRKPKHTAYQSHKLIWEEVQRNIDAGMSEEDAVRKVIPQLQNYDIPRDFKCEFCPDKVFSSSADVHSHESVAHKEDVRQRELKESITTALQTSGGSGNGAQLDALVGLIGKLTEGNVALQELVAAQLQNSSGAAPAKRRGRPPKVVVGSDEPSEDDD